MIGWAISVLSSISPAVDTMSSVTLKSRPSSEWVTARRGTSALPGNDGMSVFSKRSCWIRPPRIA
ncbi:hypothetical protein BGV60_27775 [Burkholderia ubonensis]|nr:hypothetical protein BGV60_27775 [Burkholderia ubonensis]